MKILNDFHPNPEEVQCSNPVAEPDFIKPYFGLRLFPVWHVGTDYLHEIGKNWYDFLCSKGVKFHWNTKATKVLTLKKTELYLNILIEIVEVEVLLIMIV